MPLAKDDIEVLKQVFKDPTVAQMSPELRLEYWREAVLPVMSKDQQPLLAADNQTLDAYIEYLKPDFEQPNLGDYFGNAFQQEASALQQAPSDPLGYFGETAQQLGRGALQGLEYTAGALEQINPLTYTLQPIINALMGYTPEKQQAVEQRDQLNLNQQRDYGLQRPVTNFLGQALGDPINYLPFGQGIAAAGRGGLGQLGETAALSALANALTTQGGVQERATGGAVGAVMPYAGYGIGKAFNRAGRTIDNAIPEPQLDFPRLSSPDGDILRILQGNLRQAQPAPPPSTWLPPNAPTGAVRNAEAAAQPLLRGEQLRNEITTLRAGIEKEARIGTKPIKPVQPIRAYDAKQSAEYFNELARATKATTQARRKLERLGVETLSASPKDYPNTIKRLQNQVKQLRAQLQDLAPENPKRPKLLEQVKKLEIRQQALSDARKAYGDALQYERALRQGELATKPETQFRQVKPTVKGTPQGVETPKLRQAQEQATKAQDELNKLKQGRTREGLKATEKPSTKPSPIKQPETPKPFKAPKLKLVDPQEKQLAQIAKQKAQLEAPKKRLEQVQNRLEKARAEYNKLDNKTGLTPDELRRKLTLKNEIKALEPEVAKAQAKVAEKPKPAPNQPKADPRVQEVAKTEFDPSTRKGQQNPVTDSQKTLEQVADLIPTKVKTMSNHAQTLEQAMQQGKPVEVTYNRNISGSGNTGVVVGKKGEVGVETSIFTATHFKRTAKGQVMVSGYNQLGQPRSYHLNELVQNAKVTKPKGDYSSIQSVKIVDQKPFVGTTANVYRGAGEYNIDDVLNVPANATDVMKTADQIRVFETAKGLTDAVQASNLPKEAKAIFKRIMDKKAASPVEIKELQNSIAKLTKAEQATLCTLLGI